MSSNTTGTLSIADRIRRFREAPPMSREERASQEFVRNARSGERERMWWEETSPASLRYDPDLLGAEESTGGYSENFENSRRFVASGKSHASGLSASMSLATTTYSGTLDSSAYPLGTSTLPTPSPNPAMSLLASMPPLHRALGGEPNIQPRHVLRDALRDTASEEIALEDSYSHLQSKRDGGNRSRADLDIDMAKQRQMQGRRFGEYNSDMSLSASTATTATGTNAAFPPSLSQTQQSDVSLLIEFNRRSAEELDSQRTSLASQEASGVRIKDAAPWRHESSRPLDFEGDPKGGISTNNSKDPPFSPAAISIIREEGIGPSAKLPLREKDKEVTFGATPERDASSLQASHKEDDELGEAFQRLLQGLHRDEERIARIARGEEPDDGRGNMHSPVSNVKASVDSAHTPTTPAGKVNTPQTPTHTMASAPALAPLTPVSSNSSAPIAATPVTRSSHSPRGTTSRSPRAASLNALTPLPTTPHGRAVVHVMTPAERTHALENQMRRHAKFEEQWKMLTAVLAKQEQMQSQMTNGAGTTYPLQMYDGASTSAARLARARDKQNSASLSFGDSGAEKGNDMAFNDDGDTDDAYGRRLDLASLLPLDPLNPEQLAADNFRQRESLLFEQALRAESQQAREREFDVNYSSGTGASQFGSSIASKQGQWTGLRSADFFFSPNNSGRVQATAVKSARMATTVPGMTAPLRLTEVNVATQTRELSSPTVTLDIAAAPEAIVETSSLPQPPPSASSVLDVHVQEPGALSQTTRNSDVKCVAEQAVGNVVQIAAAAVLSDISTSAAGLDAAPTHTMATSLSLAALGVGLAHAVASSTHANTSSASSEANVATPGQERDSGYMVFERGQWVMRSHHPDLRGQCTSAVVAPLLISDRDKLPSTAIHAATPAILMEAPYILSDAELALQAEIETLRARIVPKEPSVTATHVSTPKSVMTQIPSILPSSSIGGVGRDFQNSASSSNSKECSAISGGRIVVPAPLPTMASTPLGTRSWNFYNDDYNNDADAFYSRWADDADYSNDYDSNNLTKVITCAQPERARKDEREPQKLSDTLNQNPSREVAVLAAENQSAQDTTTASAQPLGRSRAPASYFRFLAAPAEEAARAQAREAAVAIAAAAESAAEAKALAAEQRRTELRAAAVKRAYNGSHASGSEESLRKPVNTVVPSPIGEPFVPTAHILTKEDYLERSRKTRQLLMARIGL